jgi:hypothetical protein
MRKRVTVIIDSPQELNQSSYIRAGLFELEKAGIIKCRVKINIKRRLGRIDTESGTLVRTKHPHPKTSYYTLIDHDANLNIKFAVDLFDSPWHFSEVALKQCEYVFKRNYVTRYIQPLDSEIKKKLYPLGLSFMVGTDRKLYNHKLFIGLLLSNMALAFKFNREMPVKLWRAFQWSLMHWKGFSRSRRLKDFEFFSKLKSQFVIFQTRCFAGSESVDVKTIHQERADLIRYLKKSLVSDFKGGFIPDAIASKQFPDCLTSLPTEPTAYLQLVNESAIGIYTRGLSQSPAWKLAEYFAKGTCCVAEPLITELPQPLEPGVHFHVFKNQAECAEQCRSLLLDKTERSRMSNNARTYYENHINPAKNVLRILELMIGRKIEPVE